MSILQDRQFKHDLLWNGLDRVVWGDGRNLTAILRARPIFWHAQPNGARAQAPCSVETIWPEPMLSAEGNDPSPENHLPKGQP